jgi:D-alanyl-D-alanine carboxypeptidase
MRFRKNFSFLGLIILSIISMMTSSCKDGVSEPHFNVLTTENLAKLQSAADKAITSLNTPGLVAYISVEGEGELVIARGVSNLVTDEPMNANNYFRIGSITKTFTTEAVLILADLKLIDLNKSISDYLPELKLPSGDKITIRMLGNMTSGLYDTTNDAELMIPYLNSNGQIVITPEEIIAVVAKHPLNFTPGTKYEYCSSNTIILGLLIQKVTGKTVKDVLNEMLFLPLGMTKTYWPTSRYLPYPYTHGYKYGTDVTNWSPSHADAAGILISNFGDLKVWIKEIHEGNLLSAEAMNERFKWVDQDGKGITFYSFGLSKSRGWIGHSGGINGYNSMLFYHGEKKITIIVSTNSEDDSPAAKVFFDFAEVLGAW